MSSEETKPKVEEQEVKEKEPETEKASEAEERKEKEEETKKEVEDGSTGDKEADKNAADDATDGDEDTEGDEVKKPAKKRPVKADDDEKDEGDDDDEGKGTEEDDEDDADEDATTEDEKKNGIAKKGKKGEDKKDKKEDIEIPAGKGTAFKDCPRIEHFINQRELDQLKKLHQAIYGKVGKVDAIKSNLLEFNGFDYEPESDNYTKKKQQIAKMDFKHMKDICDILDIEKKGKKDDIVTRIMDFLMEPKDSGKAVPAVPPPRPKRTSAVKANNRGYAGQDSDDEEEGGKRGRAGRRAKARPSYKDDSSSEEDKPRRGGRKFSESDADSDPDISPSESDSDSPKKKKKVTPTKPRGRGAPKKTPAAKTPKRGAPKRGKAKKASESDERSESEDEPLQKKSKKFPNDEEIKKVVKQILDGANLEEITMKTVCKQVYSKYPDHDLTHKKDLIKTTVKSLIST